MQSFLQYRKCRLAVEKQLRRNQEKEIGWAETRQPSQLVPLPVQAPPAAVQDPPFIISESASEDDIYEEDTESDQSGSVMVPTPTRYSARTALGHALTGIYARDRTTHEGKGSKVFVVHWEGERDPFNPRNWSMANKMCTTLVISAIGFAVTAASSIDTAILPQASAEFGVSDVVESLATGVFIPSH